MVLSGLHKELTIVTNFSLCWTACFDCLLFVVYIIEMKLAPILLLTGPH